jgi:MFS family permease
MISAAFAGSTLVTPLYVIYKQEFGFSQITLTLVYGAYVLGNLVALLFFGHVSDEIGRRRTILPAMAIAIASTLVFLFAESLAWLYAARILSGIGIGIATGAGTLGSRNLPVEATSRAPPRSQPAPTSSALRRAPSPPAFWRNMRHGRYDCRSSSISSLCSW